LNILFDEDVPSKLARSLPQHEIHTVVSKQWGGIKNGALLTLIGLEGFDRDKNMGKQQRLKAVRSVLILSAINWPVIRPHIQEVAVALNEAEAGTVKTVECGVFIARLKRPKE
jgi:hypothetical protein